MRKKAPPTSAALARQVATLRRRVRTLEDGGARLRALFEHADDLMVSCRIDGTIVDVNHRDLDRLSAPIVSRIIESVSRLEANPFGPPPKIKKLKGKSVGQWRRVRHRKEVYEDQVLTCRPSD